MLCWGATETKVPIQCLHSIDFHLHNLCWTWETWWWMCCLFLFWRYNLFLKACIFGHSIRVDWHWTSLWGSIGRRHWAYNIRRFSSRLRMRIFGALTTEPSLVYFSFLWIHVEASVCVNRCIPRPRKIVSQGQKKIKPSDLNFRGLVFHIVSNTPTPF